MTYLPRLFLSSSHACRKGTFATKSHASLPACAHVYFTSFVRSFYMTYLRRFFLSSSHACRKGSLPSFSKHIFFCSWRSGSVFFYEVALAFTRVRPRLFYLKVVSKLGAGGCALWVGVEGRAGLVKN